MDMEEVVTDMEDHTTEEVAMGIKATSKDIKDTMEVLDALSFLTLMDTKPEHIVMAMGAQATTVIMVTVMGATTEDTAMVIITTVRNLRNTFTFIAITIPQEQQRAQQLVQQQQQAQQREQPTIRPTKRLFISVAAGHMAADAVDTMATDTMASDTDITVAIAAVDTAVDTVLTTLLLSRT